MPDTSLIILVVVLALTFDFINGFHDTANAIATCVSTRAIRPGVAIIGTAILNFLGAMISTGVAKTIGGDIRAAEFCPSMAVPRPGTTRGIMRATSPYFGAHRPG